LGVRKIQLTYRSHLEPTFERLFNKLEVIKKRRPLPPIALHKIKESLAVEWTYHSNSIEGNSLTLRETQMVLQEGITIKGKSLKEHFEVKNHEFALAHLEQLSKSKKNLTIQEILELHGYIMRSVEDLYAGRLRNGGVRIAGANFIPPHAHKVSDLLDDLMATVNHNPMGLNPIEMAAFFHHQMVWIHPFFDGNGRTARLAMNLILIRAGFPPAIILRQDRKKYYTALNSANQGNYQKLMLLMAQALERSLNIYLSILPDAEEEYMEISNLVKEPDFPYGQEYISLLARQGKIDAHKEGKNWHTSKAAVTNYILNRKRKRHLQ